MFDSLLNHLNHSIKLHEGKSLEIDESLAECVSNKNSSVIRSWLWDVPGFRRWRVTRMDAGEKLQVLNSVAYPEYIYDQPIMGIDLLWFGKKDKLVAVLDFQPLVQDEVYLDQYFDGLKLIRKKFPEFTNSNDMHLYENNNYFSPWLLFCRGGQIEVNTLLPIIFKKFLSAYWSISKINSGNYLKIDPGKVRNLHILYDKYNSERDPAHGLFVSYFGKEWSDHFLSHFLFPTSQEF